MREYRGLKHRSVASCLCPNWGVQDGAPTIEPPSQGQRVFLRRAGIERQITTLPASLLVLLILLKRPLLWEAFLGHLTPTRSRTVLSHRIPSPFTISFVLINVCVSSVHLSGSSFPKRPAL